MQKLLIEVPNRAKHFARFFRIEIISGALLTAVEIIPVIYKFVRENNNDV